MGFPTRRDCRPRAWTLRLAYSVMDVLLLFTIILLAAAGTIGFGVWRLGGVPKAQAWLRQRLGSRGGRSSTSDDVHDEEEESFWRSFERQISSAERRGDTEEVERLRREYEGYEEAWRAQRTLRGRAPANFSSEIEGGLSPNRLTELRTLLERSRRLDSLSAEDWALRGNAYLAVDDADRAVEAYRQALRAQPDDLDVVTHFATALGRIGRLHEALEAYDRLLQTRPTDPDLNTSRGNVLTDLDRSQEALEAYEAALNARPDHAEALYNRGNVLSDFGRLDEALDSYQGALRVRADLPDLHNDMGNTLALLGRHEDALRAYEQAIKLRPSHARAYYNRGVTLTRLGQFEEAAEAFERCLRLRLDIPEAHYGKGVAFARLSRFDEALSAFDRALALRPAFPDALFNKARTHSRLGQQTEAIEWLKQAISASPELRTQAMNEPDFESLRSHPQHGQGFRAAVEG